METIRRMHFGKVFWGDWPRNQVKQRRMMQNMTEQK